MKWKQNTKNGVQNWYLVVGYVCDILQNIQFRRQWEHGIKGLFTCNYVKFRSCSKSALTFKIVHISVKQWITSVTLLYLVVYSILEKSDQWEMCSSEDQECNVQYESKTKYYIHYSGCYELLSLCYTWMSFAFFFVYCANNFEFFSVFGLTWRHRDRCNPSFISY